MSEKKKEATSEEVDADKSAPLGLLPDGTLNVVEPDEDDEEDEDSEDA